MYFLVNCGREILGVLSGLPRSLATVVVSIPGGQLGYVGNPGEHIKRTGY